MRDVDLEARLLEQMVDLTYCLLQRDWRDPRHGDLDLALSAEEFSQMALIVTSFARANGMQLCKAYEICDGNVVLALADSSRTIYLDIVLSGICKTVYTIHTIEAVAGREMVEGAYVIAEPMWRNYNFGKQVFKRSGFARLRRRLTSIPFLCKRLPQVLASGPGVLLYVPKVADCGVLNLPMMADFAAATLANVLLRKYCSAQN